MSVCVCVCVCVRACVRACVSMCVSMCVWHASVCLVILDFLQVNHLSVYPGIDVSMAKCVAFSSCQTTPDGYMSGKPKGLYKYYSMLA